MANAALKAAETLRRLLDQARADEAPPKPDAETLQRWRDEMAKWREQETWRLEIEWEGKAERLASALLHTNSPDAISDRWTRSAFHWRAENLGAEQAEFDFQTGRSGGWSSRFWDENGKLWPLEEPRKTPSYMTHQHANLCAAKRREMLDEAVAADGWGGGATPPAQTGES